MNSVQSTGHTGSMKKDSQSEVINSLIDQLYKYISNYMSYDELSNTRRKTLNIFFHFQFRNRSSSELEL